MLRIYIQRFRLSVIDVVPECLKSHLDVIQRDNSFPNCICARVVVLVRWLPRL